MLFLNRHPKKGYIYAITKGKYAGQLFVFIETKKQEHCFLSLPQMINRTVPVDKFKIGIKLKIVETVERLPKPIYITCKAQYAKNQLSPGKILQQV